MTADRATNADAVGVRKQSVAPGGGRPPNGDAPVLPPQTPQAIRPLASTVRRGAAMSGLALVVVQVVSVAQTLLLARLLSPAEVGLFAAGTVLSGFLVSFTESGLRGALVQRETDVERAAETVFYVTAATGVAMGLGVLAAAPVIAWLFGNETAGLIAAVTSAHCCSTPWPPCRTVSCSVA